MKEQSYGISKTEARYVFELEIADFLKEQHELAQFELPDEALDLAEEYRRALENALCNAMARSPFGWWCSLDLLSECILHELKAEELYTEESLFVERYEKLIETLGKHWTESV